MGSGSIVVSHPVGNDAPGVVETEERRLVQQFVPHLGIEAFADHVLHRLGRRDEVPGQACLVAPGQLRVQGELGTVIADNQVGLASPDNGRRQFPGGAAAGDRGLDHGGEAFLRDIVNHVEDPELPTLGELIVDEIDRPAHVRPGHRQQRYPRPGRLLLPPSFAHRQPFLAVEPMGLLAVHDIGHPDSAEHAVAGSRTGAVRMPALGQIVIVGASAAIADRGPAGTDYGTRPPLVRLVLLHEDRNGFAPGAFAVVARTKCSPMAHRFHFRDRRSSSIARSSRDSASSRFGRAFSSSSAFSRFA